MNAAECARLCDIIASVAPAQRFTDETPIVWLPLLGGCTYGDAAAAAQAVLSRQAFVAPSEILAEVWRIRDGRQAAVAAPLPNVDPDDVLGWAAEERALVRAIRDGRMSEQEARAYERSGQVLTAGARPRVVGQRRDRSRELEAAVGEALPRTP